MSTIKQNLREIEQRMQAACLRAGRELHTVRLIGVTKTVPTDRIREGVQAGLTILGESYIQEAREKIRTLSDLAVSWEFIGHLQSNKARLAAELFDCIQTVDRESLARELNRQAQKLGRRIPVLIQVNVGDEESKSGVHAKDLPGLFCSIAPLEGIVVRGLMALPPYHEDPQEVRPYFRRLRQLMVGLRDSAPTPEHLIDLSMGMSHDFEVAIEEGATLIRIGTALFGSR